MEDSKIDIVIIGGGPAALTAGLYIGRAGKKCLLFEKNLIGGRIQETHVVDNIPGCPSVNSADFADSLATQCEEAGTEIKWDGVSKILGPSDNLYTIFTESGEKYTSPCIIIATGTTPRLLGLPMEDRLIGNGLSFCALCDGAFYKDKEVIVIGGGNSAITEAIELAEICAKVTIVQNLEALTAEKQLIDELNKFKNVEIICNATVKEYLATWGTFECKGIAVEKKGSSELTMLKSDGVFLAIGMIPQTKFLNNFVELDREGYIITRDGHKTNKIGVFACGDCQADTYKQVVIACGNGASAAIEAIDFVRTLKK